MPHLFVPFRHWASGLRSRLYCVAILAVLPVGLIRLVERSADADRALAGAEVLLSGLADRGVAAAMDVIDDARGTLEILSQVPAIQTYRSPDCGELLTGITKGRAWAITMSVLDASGVARCSTGPDAVGVNFADRPYVQQTILNRAFSVSELLVARVTRRPTVAAAMPVIVNGSLRSILVVTLDLEQLDRAVAQVEHTVEGGVAYIVHPGSAEDGNLVGARLKLGGDDERGLTALQDADGIERIYAVRPLPYTKAKLVVGMPRAKALAKVVERDWRTLAELTAIALLIAAAIGIGGHFLILRPLRALGRAASDWSRGELDARASLPGAPASEFLLLAETMNTMAEHISDRERLLASARDELVGLAFRDSLTEIANRRCFEQQLAEDWELWMDEARQLAIVMIDVDFFKNYNDRYGHQAGDAVLRRVASRIQAASETHDCFAARLGGEEFGVIVQGDEARARVVAELIRASISALNIEHAGSILHHVTVSIGCAAVATESARSSSDIMQAADVRLYIAKKLGRNRIAASAELEGFPESDEVMEDAAPAMLSAA